jgi:hypothetical protein
MKENGTSADSISADMSAVLGALSFWRITHVPFAAWLAALERWQLTGHGSELRLGNSQLHGPAEHDPHFGTCQIGVRLARGRYAGRCACGSTSTTGPPPRPHSRSSRASRYRLGTAYFHAGRRLLDSLTCAAGTPASAAALQQRQHTPVTRLSGHPPAGREPEIPGVRQPVPALARRHTS